MKISNIMSNDKKEMLNIDEVYSKKIKVFHGTHLKDLLFLKAGTWITESEETARTFGENVYSLYIEDDDVKWEYLSADVCDWNTNGEGEWRGELKKNIALCK